MRAVFASVVDIDGMSAVEIGTCRNSVSVSIPDCSSVIRGVELKGITMFAQSIKTWLIGQRCSQVEIL